MTQPNAQQPAQTIPGQTLALVAKISLDRDAVARVLQAHRAPADLDVAQVIDFLEGALTRALAEAVESYAPAPGYTSAADQFFWDAAAQAPVNYEELVARIEKGYTPTSEERADMIDRTAHWGEGCYNLEELHGMTNAELASVLYQSMYDYARCNCGY